MEKSAPDPILLDRLSRLEPHTWSGTVWRHTFADNPPETTNTRGARWNPPGVDDEALSGDDHSRCQAIGGASALLHFDGIIVPSARSPGHNIVILFESGEPLPQVHVVESEALDRP